MTMDHNLRHRNLKKFAREWGFEHVTSSRHYAQSNGNAENAVKTAKSLLKKAKLDGSDPLKVILEWRNTPTEGLESSPAQRLMSRRTRTLLSTQNSLLGDTGARREARPGSDTARYAETRQAQCKTRDIA